jgi:hypothetical protein
VGVEGYTVTTVPVTSFVLLVYLHVGFREGYHLREGLGDMEILHLVPDIK